ncbi:MAG: PEP-CTERM sorting domain-containing protein, partial [Acidobacteriaceae bacterium]|nr:PEP-CTERM sorting domain-containing protein [Acidobacteriaceae bacterium]
PGESFKILTFAPGELSGSFDRILGDPNFTIDYNEAGGYVSITAEPVPEPGTLLLTGFALFGFGAYAVCRFVKRCEPVVE